jgi:hypothetical protein
LLDIATENLTIYYSGRRSEIFDYDDQKVTSIDQVIVFDDGYLIDDDLSLLLQKHPKGKNTKIFLVSDLHETGTVWDIPIDKKQVEREFVPNIVSICNTCSFDDFIVPSNEPHYQGLFTYYLFASTALNGSFIPNKELPLISSLLSPYKLSVDIISTNPQLLEENIFTEVT